MTFYRCPICFQELNLQLRQYQCPSRHHFDCAKEGYVNLLPVQNKRSKEPGDSSEMLAARRNFLRQGYYIPLRDALLAHLNQTDFQRVLDIGTGEGWYLGELQRLLTDGPRFHGIDIAKAGIRMAAKAYPHCQFAVASSQQLPFRDHCFDRVLNIFAPLHPPEVLRILGRGGQLLRVSPASEHLFALKQLLYPQARPHAETQPTPDGFRLQATERVQGSFTLEKVADLENLILMTPYGWQARASQPQDFSPFLPLQLRLDVWLQAYQPQ